jgi:hypothetical protein
LGDSNTPFGLAWAGGEGDEASGEVVLEGDTASGASWLWPTSAGAGRCVVVVMVPVTASKTFGAIGVMTVMWLEVCDS